MTLHDHWGLSGFGGTEGEMLARRMELKHMGNAEYVGGGVGGREGVAE